jgi:HK97 family phage major capsid protein
MPGTYDSLTARADLAGLIPTETAAGIIQSAAQASVAMATFRRVTMPRGTTQMPVLSVMPTAYWVGASDTGLKQTTEQNWENVELLARELAVIVPIPQAVIDDATVDLWAEVRPRLAEAFGQKVDAACLFGTDKPSGWGDSIVEAAVAASNEFTVGATGNVSGVTGDIAHDINEAWALVEDDGFEVNVQWARRRIRARLRGLRDDNGQPVFQNGLERGAPASLYGEDLIFVGNGAWDDTYALVVGDRNAAILGVRQDITYRIFTEGVISDESGAVVLNLMQQDAVALRAVMRVGYAVANPANPIQGDGGAGASGFPFAVLTEAGS